MVQIPQYTRGLITKERAVTPVANPQAVQNEQTSIATVLDPLAKFANQYAEKLDKENAAVKLNEAWLSKSQYDFDLTQKYQDIYKDNPEELTPALTSVISQNDASLLAGLPERAQGEFGSKAMMQNEAMRQNAIEWSQQRKVDQISNQAELNLAQTQDFAITLGTKGGDINTLPSMINQNLASIYAIHPTDKADQIKFEAVNKIYQSYWNARIQNDPTGALKAIQAGEAGNYVDAGTIARLQTDAYNAQPAWTRAVGDSNNQIPTKGDGSPEWIIGNILKTEGGFNPNDGGRGFPVIYGITQKNYPDQYAEALRITQEQGEAAGKLYAEQFYKTEYYDKYNIGELPEATREIVMDALVNQGTWAQELVTDARNGATPDTLLQKRKARYDAIVQGDSTQVQNYNGWINRLSSLSSSIPGSPEAQAKAVKEVRNDPVGAMFEAGIGKTPEELVQNQKTHLGIPAQRASVMSNGQAMQAAQALNDARDVDGFLAISRQLTQQYPNHKQNFLSDIAKAKQLPDNKIIALQMAISNEAQYKQHIELAMRMDTEDSKKMLRGQTESESGITAIDEKLNEQMPTVISALASEGYSQKQIAERWSTIQGIAYQYALKHNQANAQAVADFALQPVFGEHAYEEFNGVGFRIPKIFMNDADEILSNLPDVIENRLNIERFSAGKNTEQKQLDMEDLIVVMAEDEKGLAVMDKNNRFVRINGQPLVLDFAYLINPNLETTGFVPKTESQFTKAFPELSKSIFPSEQQ